MIHGVGVDIQDSARLESLRGKYSDPFFSATYTEAEYEVGIGKPDPILYFTERFAAKEAVFKALNVNSTEFRFTDIETRNDDTGKPVVALYMYTRKLYEEKGINSVHLSISNDNGFVVAIAVCEK